MNRHTRALLGTVVPSSCERELAMRIILAVLAFVLYAPWVEASCVVDTSTPTYDNGKYLRDDPCTPIGARKTAEQYDGGGQNSLLGYTNTESHWSVLPTGATTAMFAADTAIKNAPGFLHAITCYSDATATAGTIALLDNTAAGAGNKLWEFAVLAVAYNTPFSVLIDTPFAVGLYADFTTTADVKCMVQYR